MRLQGKRAIITGAARGIGKGIALKFLQEGASVLISDVNEEQLAQTQKELEKWGDVHSFCIDVTNPDEVQAMVEKAWNIWGRIDILANNAGIGTFEKFMEISDDSWNRILNVNLTGNFYVAKAVAKVMSKQQSGSIINMASTNGKLGEAGLAHYNASKGGIVLLSKTMAIELGAHHVRVNSVCPGLIATNLAVEAGMEEDTLEQYAKEHLPLGRRGTVEEVANVFAFLASDESSFITGTEIVVDGGQICQQ